MDDQRKFEAERVHDHLLSTVHEASFEASRLPSLVNTELKISEKRKSQYGTLDDVHRVSSFGGMANQITTPIKSESVANNISKRQELSYDLDHSI